MYIIYIAYCAVLYDTMKNIQGHMCDLWRIYFLHPTSRFVGWVV